MPDSASQVLTGTLRSSARGLLALEADDGGVWQLDVGFSWRARRLVGRRVSVLGTRAGFDLLDVTRVEPLQAVLTKGIPRDAGFLPIIPPRSNRKVPEHPDYRRQRDRNRVERMFGRLKQQRRIATRYDKTILAFESFLNLAATRLWLQSFVNAAQVTASLCRNPILIEASWTEAGKLASRLSYRVATARKCFEFIEEAFEEIAIAVEERAEGRDAFGSAWVSSLQNMASRRRR